VTKSKKVGRSNGMASRKKASPSPEIEQLMVDFGATKTLAFAMQLASLMLPDLEPRAGESPEDAPRRRVAVLITHAVTLIDAGSPDPWLASLARIFGGLSAFAHSHKTLGADATKVELLEQQICGALLDLGIDRNHNFVQRMKRGQKRGSNRKEVLEAAVEAATESAERAEDTLFCLFRDDLPRINPSWIAPNEDTIRASVRQQLRNGSETPEQIQGAILKCASALKYPDARNLFSYLDKQAKRGKRP